MRRGLQLSTIVFLLLFGSVLVAAEQELLLVNDDGLWHWQPSKQELSLLLKGAAGAELQVDEKPEKVFSPYPQSRVAVSKSGQWLAVSGQVTIRPTYGEILDQALSQATAPTIRSYRIYLVDLSSNTTYTIFDSHEWRTLGPHHIEEFDRDLQRRWPHLISREFGANPINNGDASEDPFYESFEWGDEARLQLQFNDEADLLYLRVVTAPQRQAGKTYNIYEGGVSWYDDLNTTPSVHRSFVFDISDPGMPILRRAIVPNQAYFTTTTLLEAGKGKETFSLSPDMQYLATSHLIPKELANKYLSIFGARDRYMHLLRVETEIACDEYFDRDMQRQNLLERRHAFQEPFDPDIHWFGNRLTVRKDNNSVDVYDVAALVPQEQLVCSSEPVVPRTMTPIFATDNTARLRMHGVSVEHLQGAATHEDYRTSHTAIYGDYLLVSQRVPILRQVSLDLTQLFNLKTWEVRYLAYPAMLSKPFFGAPIQHSTWDNIQRARAGAKNELDLLYLRSSPEYRYLLQDAMVREFEGETLLPQIASDQGYVYFLESRLKGLPSYPVLREAGLAKGRHEPFEKIAWPVLARLPMNTGDEAKIERLGMMQGRTGWHRGLDLSDAIVTAPVKPLQKVYHYIALPTPLSKPMPPSTSQAAIAK